MAGFTYLTANNVGVGVTVSSSAKFEVNGLVSATSGIIYGGLTVTGAVSASSVSATNISATMIQVGAGGTCAASVSGSIRYGAASNTLQICTGTGWVSLSSAAPPRPPPQAPPPKSSTTTTAVSAPMPTSPTSAPPAA